MKKRIEIILMIIIAIIIIGMGILLFSDITKYLIEFLGLFMFNLFSFLWAVLFIMAFMAILIFLDSKW